MEKYPVKYEESMNTALVQVRGTSFYLRCPTCVTLPKSMSTKMGSSIF